MKNVLDKVNLVMLNQTRQTQVFAPGRHFSPLDLSTP